MLDLEWAVSGNRCWVSAYQSLRGCAGSVGGLGGVGVVLSRMNGTLLDYWYTDQAPGIS